MNNQRKPQITLILFFAFLLVVSIPVFLFVPMNTFEQILLSIVDIVLTSFLSYYLNQLRK